MTPPERPSRPGCFSARAALACFLCLTSFAARAAVPDEIEGLAWCSSSKTCLTWSSAPDASSYDVYRGEGGTLRALRDASIDACRAGSFKGSSTSSTMLATPPAGSLHWYLVTGSSEDGEGSAGSTSDGPRELNADSPCSASCGLEGASCKTPDECCSDVCINHACGPPCAMGTAACSIPEQCCSGVCEAGSCAVACTPAGGPCISGARCCSHRCGAGLCLPPCTPNGGGCVTAQECCSGLCDLGTCRAPCVPSGSPCSPASSCCNGMCVSGRCQAGGCVPEGGPCSTSTQCCSEYCVGGYCY